MMMISDWMASASFKGNQLSWLLLNKNFENAQLSFFHNKHVSCTRVWRNCVRSWNLHQPGSSFWDISSGQNIIITLKEMCIVYAQIWPILESIFLNLISVFYLFLFVLVFLYCIINNRNPNASRRILLTQLIYRNRNTFYSKILIDFIYMYKYHNKKTSKYTQWINVVRNSRNSDIIVTETHLKYTSNIPQTFQYLCYEHIFS